MAREKLMDITRRRLMVGGSVASLVTLSHVKVRADNNDQKPSTRPASFSIEEVEKEFRRLVELWRKESEQFSLASNTNDYWQGPNGRALIMLGPAIIPYLIAELRQGNFFFNVPLAAMTRIDIANGQVLSEQQKARRWINWWAGPNQAKSKRE